VIHGNRSDRSSGSEEASCKSPVVPSNSDWYVRNQLTWFTRNEKQFHAFCGHYSRSCLNLETVYSEMNIVLIGFVTFKSFLLELKSTSLPRSNYREDCFYKFENSKTSFHMVLDRFTTKMKYFSERTFLHLRLLFMLMLILKVICHRTLRCGMTQRRFRSTKRTYSNGRWLVRSKRKTISNLISRVSTRI
jgi:hypothetical protein